MAENRTPASKQELLDAIEREWTALLRVVEGTGPQQMVRPDSGGWSPKDNLAHLAAWMHFMLDHHLAGKPAHEVLGMDEAEFKRLDEDGENAVIFERNRNRPVDDVLAELKRVYADVIATLDKTPFSDLLKPRYPDDPQSGPMLNSVTGNTSEHFEEHRRAIEAANRK